MIPNKPSLLVAPNGSGKSSFAFAFQWLNRQHIKMDPNDAYLNDVRNKPEIKVTTDDGEYKADENTNDISKKFGICVINSGLEAKSPRVVKGVQYGKSLITIPDIIICKIADNVDFSDDFETVYDLQMPTGTYPSINADLTDNKFLSMINVAYLRAPARGMKKILVFIETTKSYTGTIVARHERMQNDDLKDLLNIPCIQYAYDLFNERRSADIGAKNLCRAVRLVTLYYREASKLSQRIEYAKNKITEDSYRELFVSLGDTWNGIRLKREKGQLILSINDAQRISNGERDVRVLIANLLKAPLSLTKEYNILIIDEVFDYLDDANMLAAQNFITQLIQGAKANHRFIYPIILTHLNPGYYRSYAFSHLKVYYLKPLPYSTASDNMMKLLQRRKAYNSANPNDDKISKYMLHYHTNYTEDLSAILNLPNLNWEHVDQFKKYCHRNMMQYLQNQDYDALAVCVDLRETIEKYSYGHLNDAAQKSYFLEDNNCHGTEKKLDYAEECGVTIPESFRLLGLIYNDPMHPKDKGGYDIRQTLYSSLENNVVRHIVESVNSLR